MRNCIVVQNVINNKEGILSAWLSKLLKNGSSRPRASEAAGRGKHAYPDGELQIAENEGGASLRSQ